jgi:transcriptional regulator with XRE-family HTH domain
LAGALASTDVPCRKAKTKYYFLVSVASAQLFVLLGLYLLVPLSFKSPELRHILATNIKNHRHLLDLSQAKLAEKANIAPGYLATIELEKSFPSDDVLERIANALKIDPIELFSKNGYSIEAVRTFQKSVLEEIDKTVKTQIALFEAKIWDDKIS